MAKLDFTAYMEALATSLKDVAHVPGDNKNKHYYTVSDYQSLEGLIKSFTSVSGTNIVAEDNAEGMYGETNGQYVYDNMNCSFFVIKTAKQLDAADRKAVKDECKAVMQKILSKIRRDHLTDAEGSTNIGLRNLDMGSIHYFTFGPVLNNSYGVHCTFIVQQSGDVKYNSEDWQ